MTHYNKAMHSDEIIPYIKQFVELEDAITIKLNDFLSQILKNSPIDDDFKEHIKEQLNILCVDGEKHLKLVKEIENYVERSDQDEF